MELYSARDGRTVALGSEIARGGEGAIFALRSDPRQLAKSYLSPPSVDRLAKLQAMVATPKPNLIAVAAWPTELLVKKRGDPATRAVGFLMPKASAPEQLHELYTPKSRAHTFPEADLRFILHAAANVVRAFGAVHEAGHVIGDVNHGHLLIGVDGRVTLIDCDSFQITEGSRLFTCDVGVPLFTAPELQGQNFRGLVRTANHDRFGLAVLLFHLLFLGRHPYSGVPLNPQQSAEIEPAIRAGRFAYGARRRQLGVEQPPGTIALDTYGAEIGSLFEAAFSYPPVQRPDEKRWLNALTAAQKGLRACAASPAHQIPAQSKSCPWCAIEARTGVRLFGIKLQGQPQTGTADIAALWRAIEGVPRPQPVTDVATSTLSIPARTTAEQKRYVAQLYRKVTAAIVLSVLFAWLASINQWGWGLILGMGAGFAIWPRIPEADRSKRQLAVRNAEAELQRLREEWKRTATEAGFASAQRGLEEAKAKLARLPAERSRRIAELTSEAKQREVYLDRFRIGREKIPGIGQGRAATLASFGIETAWDVSAARVMAVPGFGPTLASNLIAWRATHLSRFRYNPNQTPAPADVRAIDADLTNQRTAAIGALRSGPAALQRANTEAALARQRLQPLIEQRHIALKVAQRAVNDG